MFIRYSLMFCLLIGAGTALGATDCRAVRYTPAEKVRYTDTESLWVDRRPEALKQRACFMEQIQTVLTKRDGKQAAEKGVFLLQKIMPSVDRLFEIVQCQSWPSCHKAVAYLPIATTNQLLERILANISIPIPSDADMPDNTLYTTELMTDLQKAVTAEYGSEHWKTAEKLLQNIKEDYIDLITLIACPTHQKCTPKQQELAAVDYDLFLNWYLTWATEPFYREN